MNPAEADRRQAEPGTTIRLPLITVTVRRDAPPGPTRAPSGDLGGSQRIPPLVFYAGLAALGVLEVVEWPVAAVVAAGVWLAGRSRSEPPAALPAAAVVEKADRGGTRKTPG